MILITGAAGKTGKAILNRLAGKSEPVRVFVRKTSQAEELAACGAAETSLGLFSDPQALRIACQGIRAVYHICPNMAPDEVEIAARLVESARAAGVEHFVYHSVLHPQIQAMPHHWNKMRVEDLLFTCKIPFTILQPTAYMQNVLGYWDQITKEHRYPVPYPVGTRLSLIDLEDLASAAARVLTETGHEHAIYELCGSESLSQVEIAAVLSQESGSQVEPVQVPLSTWEKQAREAGLNDYARETLLKMFMYYENYGLLGSPNQLTWLLQRAPATFASFIHRTFRSVQN